MAPRPSLLRTLRGHRTPRLAGAPGDGLRPSLPTKLRGAATMLDSGHHIHRRHKQCDCLDTPVIYWQPCLLGVLEQEGKAYFLIHEIYIS
ncbi:hypothetical protein U9M48_008283 [Paspalum notatum var. saurae]|uniref:Uncharacterized protein n=1 Tax=Paspalum notatum var. saurae TaxID=547442 RepID=A0AAQ3WDD2_PASNO